MRPVIRSILVPVDFSPCSDRAVHFARALAQGPGVSLHLLHVVEFLIVMPPGWGMEYFPTNFDDLQSETPPMIPPRRVLAAVDFSETSRTALAFAARLAHHCGAELHVVYAQDPLLDAAARVHGVDLETEAHEELHSFMADEWPASQL